MLNLSFKQTPSEFMVRVASSLIFKQLVDSNFPIVRIRDITDSVQYGYTEKAVKEEIGPKYVRITDLQDGKIRWDTVPYCACEQPGSYLITKNDLLFARTGATTGKTHLVKETPPNSVFASYLIRVRPKKNVNPDYLYSFFQSDQYWSQISEQKEGSAQPNVNGQKLSNIEIPLIDNNLQLSICEFLSAVRLRQDGIKTDLPELPFPLEKQRRVVERIETLAARVAEIQTLRIKAIEETEVLLKSRINQVLDEKVGSGTWKWAHLPDFVSTNRYAIKRGPFGSHLRKEFFVPTGYKVYEQKHAIYGDFTVGSYFIDEDKFRELKSFAVKPGDIIISCSGTIGKVAIVPENAQPGIINQALLKLTLDSKKIDSQFFKIVFESDFVRRAVDAISPGSAMKNIGSVKILKKIKFPMPSLEEQREFVSYLGNLEKKLSVLRQMQRESARELDLLLPSILEKAFKGEL